MLSCKELSDVRNNYNSALDALDVYQQVSERLRAKEKMVWPLSPDLSQLLFFQHKENAVVLFDELSIVQDKVDYFRTMMEDNDHLLGNFTAKRIGAIAEAKHKVADFVQESSSNLKKIAEESKLFGV